MTEEQKRFEVKFAKDTVDAIVLVVKNAAKEATERHKTYSECPDEECCFDLMYMDQIMNDTDRVLRRYFKDELCMRTVPGGGGSKESPR